MIGADACPVLTVPLRDERDIAAARSAVSRELDKRGARALRKVRFVTAVSEIVRNAVDHGGGGEMSVFVKERPLEIWVRCTDTGPGIADIDEALQDGFSTARSMGKGLGGAKRLVDSFEITSRVGGGTTVEISAAL
ncbi:ATP-binding protein [Brevirhabdus pacifica]|uniref:ATP-binding protein n=1 Tax=Brevirhabdus pacifica TaxID=1267768 RepID=A0A1U7DJW7_9RHOB|nr:ATP-binding protein [Brevirhabdus pacifica]APX90193.1 ATP-binding protein [Brevirhabdus pacifica]PJJ80623.1 serine/threonine-protein kinase RsbT [Brevirhabdus pacifica]